MKPKSTLRSFLSITGSTLLAISYAHAATLYWDGGTVNIGTDGNGLSNGAAGNWDATLTNWDQGAGLAHVAWTGTTYTAVLGRTGIAGGTVTLTAPVSVGGLTIYGTGFTVAASTQGLTFGATNNNITLFGSSGATASAAITGTVTGSGNVSLTSANPIVTGTMTFSGISAGGWSGTTTINPNMILATTTTSGNVNQVLNSTSGITLNGGAIQFNRATNAQLNAISDSAAITVNVGGTLGVTSGDAGGANANETIGAVTLSSGQMNFNWTNSPSSGAQIILSSLSRSGTASATFSGLHTGSGGRWKVTSAGTTNAGEIIGAWATTGAANGIAAQTDYAVYSADFLAAAGISASAETAWTTAGNAYTMGIGTAASGTTLTGTRDITALRISGTRLDSVDFGAPETITLTGHGFTDGEQVVFGKDAPGALTAGTAYFVISAAANTFQVSTTSGGAAVNLTSAGTLPEIRRSTTPTALTLASGFNLGTTGILNGSGFDMTIAPGTGGVVTLPSTTPGNLFVTAGRSNITISAPIENNTPSGVLTLVKGGSNTLALSNTSNTYTGGTVINAGTLSISDVAHLGGAGANVTFNGNGTLLNSTGSTRNFSSGTLTVNQGAVANLQPGVASAGITFATTTGSGNLVANMTGNATINIGNASGFTGNLQAKLNGNINQVGAVSIQFSSLADTAGSYLQFGGGQTDGNQSINIAFNGSAPLVFNNRRVQMLPRTGSNWVARDTFLSNNSALAANTWTINTDLDWEYTTNTGSRNFTLGGGNTGDNTFSGLISDGNSGNTPLILQKQGAGKWIVSGNNTFTGGVDAAGGTLVLSGLNQYTSATNFNGGTLVVNTIKDFGTASSIGKPASGAMLVERYTSTSTLSYVGSGDTSNRTFKFQGYSIADTPAFTLNNDSTTGALIFSAATFNEYSTSSNRIFTLNLGGTYTGGANEIQGTIQNHFSGVSDVLKLTKNGAGTWTLSGANTYTGATTVTTGVLKLNHATALPGGIAVAGGTSNLTINGGGVVGLTANSGDFLRGRGTGATQVQWTGSGGFAAYGGDRTVNLNNDGSAAQWNTGSFVTGGANLVLSAADADGKLIFANAINFAGSQRTIQVNNGSAAVDAQIDGQLQGSGSSGLNKTGAGTLAITGTNSYLGATTITAGTLALGANDVLPATPVSIGNATLDAATFDDTAGTLTVTDAASAINLGAGANLVFADSSAATWTGTLNITGTFVSGSSLRFGDGTGTGLTVGQLASITSTGWSGFGLDVNGFLTATFGGGITFADWKTTNGAGLQTLADDHDGDGVDNGTEYFLFGSGSSTGFTALPGVTNTLGTLSVTWVKGATYAGAYTTDYVVETSATLAAPWAVIATSGTPNVPDTVHISGNNVTYTFPVGTKNFARLKVTGP